MRPRLAPDGQQRDVAIGHGREDSGEGGRRRIGRGDIIGGRAQRRSSLVATDRDRSVVVVVAVGLIRAWDLRDRCRTATGGRSSLISGGRRPEPGPADHRPGRGSMPPGPCCASPPTHSRSTSDERSWRGSRHSGRSPARLASTRSGSMQGSTGSTGRSRSGLTLGCTSPPVGDSFLVAIDRDRLPTAPYQVRILGPDRPARRTASSTWSDD